MTLILDDDVRELHFAADYLRRAASSATANLERGGDKANGKAFFHKRSIMFQCDFLFLDDVLLGLDASEFGVGVSLLTELCHTESRQVPAAASTLARK
jgi:hypothetical protein